MKLRDFLRGHEFAKGTYEVRAARKNESERCLLSLDFREADEDTSRHLPALGVPERLGVQDLRLVLAAAVRAGGSHRGLRDEDLVKLHRAVAVDRHIELFTDLNAITTGLLQHLTWSLGSGIGRVVMSSSKEPLPTAATPDKKRVPEGRGYNRQGHPLGERDRSGRVP